jgi:hypothetical protein
MEGIDNFNTNINTYIKFIFLKTCCAEGPLGRETGAGDKGNGLLCGHCRYWAAVRLLSVLACCAIKVGIGLQYGHGRYWAAVQSLLVLGCCAVTVGIGLLCGH